MSRPSDGKAATSVSRGDGDRPGIPASTPFSVLKGHALWAATYYLNPNPLLALEERELEPLLPSLEGKVVIDAACGTGRWLEKLLARGARRGAGVDLSAEMLARAAGKHLLAGRLLRGDVLMLPISSGVSDLAVCSFALSYVADLDALAREFARVGRPSLDLFISDFHPGGYRRGWKRAFRYADGTVEIASVSRSIEQIRDTFASQGFELMRCHEPCLGEPERPIFEKRGKNHLFKPACEGPAVFICHFKLVARQCGRISD